MSSQACILVRVTPRSSRNRVEVSPDGSVKVWVTASPTDSQANKAVCEILAKALDLPKSAVEIVRGETSRCKSVLARGVSLEDALSRLRARVS